MNEIHIPRGTTLPLTVSVRTASGDAYAPQTGDSLILKVGSDPDNSPLITKTGSYNNETGEFEFTINPADTSSLPIDRYFYNVMLESTGNKRYPVIEATWFYVENSV